MSWNDSNGIVVIQDPRVKVYLADLTKTVSKKNVLSHEEVLAYRELQNSGKIQNNIALDQLVENSKAANEGNTVCQM